MIVRPAHMSEPKPCDFAARLPRRILTIAMLRRRRHRGRRAAVLLAAVAVPGFAAPDQWDAFTIGDAHRAEVVIAPMPFEKPGDSFPGSAFYYLTPEETRPAGPRDPAPFPQTGPAALAMHISNRGVDHQRALRCLTAAIYYEAASEPDAGQRAVAQVVLNRVAHPAYPNTVCGVVHQGSERSTGCQFSFTCDGSLARKPASLFWQRAENVARQALSGQIYAPVGLATHYHTIAVHPYWAPTLTSIGTIGAHRFYRLGGAAGRPGAFRFTYTGGEPLPVAHPRADRTVAQEAANKDQLAKIPPASEFISASAGSIPHSSAGMEGRSGEVYGGEGLPQATRIKPKYQNSGRWIAQPGV